MAGPVRQPIDVEALDSFIATHLPSIQVPLDVKQFGFGQSNPTYLLTDRVGRRYVLRKKPPGKLFSKTAHKVEREYRILHALKSTDVPVPRTYCLCEDDGVIGTPFYIMEYLDGRIVEDPAFHGVNASERTEMWRDAIHTLAKFHRVNPKTVGLERFGRATDFYNRQLETFKTVSEAQAQAIDIETNVPVGKLPHFDEMVDFFQDPRTQPEDRSGLVHGDYKIDNLVFHKTEPRVIGILDWEMSTIGHPLSDLANLLIPFTLGQSAIAIEIGRGSAAFGTGVTAGLPTMEQCLNWYREVAGWDPSPDIRWGIAFGIFRLSIIMQGIVARYARRQASSARAAEYVAHLASFTEIGWSLVRDLRQASSGARL